VYFVKLDPIGSGNAVPMPARGPVNSGDCNMFYDAMAQAIEATYPNQREGLDQMSRDVWRAHGAGQLSDDQAQQLAERIQKRRPAGAGAGAGALKAIGGPLGAPKRYRIQRSPEQRSPDRQASIEKRYRLAMSGHIPGRLNRYTISELAVLKILSDEWLAHGVCDLSLNEMGARAGVCRSVAQRTVQLAEDDGLVRVQNRPRSGRKHLPNLVWIIRAEWIDWLLKGNRKAQAARSCERAKPNFAAARQVLSSPPRSQILQKRIERRVGNSVKKKE
jgi:hypothetical protein